MSLHMEHYSGLILAAINVSQLDNIRIKVANHAKLSEEQKDQLNSLLNSKYMDLSTQSFNGKGNGKTESIERKKAPSGYIQYGDYNVDLDDELEPCTNLWQDSTYLDFMNNEFFGRFMHLPYLEQQKKLLLTLLFINSKACGAKIPLPHFYFLSTKPNSGKSTMAKFIANHYTSGSYVYIAEDTPGGTLRSIFSDANQYQNPTYCLLDNFHPQKTIERLGAFYGRLLKYTHEESECSVSQGIGKELIQFNTFGLKVFTSIFPLSNKAEELKSRCFTVLFETSPVELEDLETYNWSLLQEEYFRVWGDTAKVSNRLRYLMKKLTTIKSDKIRNRRWQLTKYLIAVGVMVGIHADIPRAIQYYEEYFEWFDSLDLKGSRNSLQLSVEEYVTKIHPKRVAKEQRLFGDEAFLKLDKIYYTDLFTFLSKNIPISKNMSTETQITAVLESQGWKLEIVRDLHGDKIDIIYRLD